MGFKERLARRLCPELGERADRYVWIRTYASDAYWWLGGYPDASDTLRWIIDGDTDRYRAIGVGAISTLPSSISDFRDYLERRRASRGES